LIIDKGFWLKNKFFLLIGLTFFLYLFLFIAPKYFSDGATNNINKTLLITGRTMGTSFSVKVPNPPEHLSQSSLTQQIEPLLLKVNQQFSHWIKDSELSQLNRLPSKTEHSLSNDVFELLSLSQEISKKTQGTFDITIAPSVNLWGFGPKDMRFEPPTTEDISLTQQAVDYTHLQLIPQTQSAIKKQDLELDMSAIAKGYGVDVIAQLLEQLHLTDYLVEIGGEIRTKGKKNKSRPWKIAIETPKIQSSQRQVFRVIQLPANGYSIATSGNYRNFFSYEGTKYSHTLDPKTGKPITNKLASLSVLIAEGKNTTARADALATALTVMGKDKALSYANKNQLAVYLLTIEDNKIIEYMSEEFRKLFN